MEFSQRIPLMQLATFCRGLSNMLESGVELDRALDVAGSKAGGAKVREFTAYAVQTVRSGGEFRDAVKARAVLFPHVFLDMVAAGEEVGHLPEVLMHLAEHFENVNSLIRTFIQKITWPAIQFVAGTLIVAGLIWILGMLGGPDMLGFGLAGGGDAIMFLIFIYGTIISLLFAYKVVSKTLAHKAKVDEFMMRIPVLGKCITSFGIARFSWAFALTQQTGMSIDRSLSLSLRATGNGSYLSTYDHIRRRIHEGEDLSTSIEETGKYPRDFVEILRVAETSGTVPESLLRLRPQFEDEARRALDALARIAQFAVWFVVAGLIIFVIFSVIMSYINMINSMTLGL